MWYMFFIYVLLEREVILTSPQTSKNKCVDKCYPEKHSFLYKWSLLKLTNSVIEMSNQSQILQYTGYNIQHVYIVSVLYVTLKVMNKLNCTHNFIIIITNNTMIDVVDWVSCLLYKLSNLQNFNALLRNFHFWTNTDRFFWLLSCF